MLDMYIAPSLLAVLSDTRLEVIDDGWISKTPNVGCSRDGKSFQLVFQFERWMAGNIEEVLYKEQTSTNQQASISLTHQAGIGIWGADIEDHTPTVAQHHSRCLSPST
jgi:hypothetical protein